MERKNGKVDLGFAIETLDDPPVLVGNIGMWGTRPWATRCATLGIALGREYIGRGYGTDAMRVIVSYGFREMGLHRIQLGVAPFNPAGIRAYEKAGFVEEGRLRESVLHDGRWYDEVLMSILDHAVGCWPARARSVTSAPQGPSTGSGCALSSQSGARRIILAGARLPAPSSGLSPATWPTRRGTSSSAIRRNQEPARRTRRHIRRMTSMITTAATAPASMAAVCRRSGRFTGSNIELSPRSIARRSMFTGPCPRPRRVPGAARARLRASRPPGPGHRDRVPPPQGRPRSGSRPGRGGRQR